MKLTFLVDNKTEKPSCTAEWGLSILIETGGHTYLYDTGASDMPVRNAAVLGADLSAVEACMLSHGHYDHTEGLPAFCRVNSKAKIYLHEEGLHTARGTMDDHNSGIRWSKDFIASIQPRLVRTHGVWPVDERLTLVGNLPNYDDFPPTDRFFITDLGGEPVPDPMNHEQFLAVFEGDAVHIISGCCHKGVVPTVRYAKQLFPDRRIASVTGGMHTFTLDAAERRRTIQALMQLGVEKLLPMHCTGMNMIADMRAAAGERCIIPCAGQTVTLA